MKHGVVNEVYGDPSSKPRRSRKRPLSAAFLADSGSCPGRTGRASRGYESGADLPFAGHLIIRVPSSVMPVKEQNRHPKKTGEARRNAKPARRRRQLVLDRAVLDLVAVLALAIGLVLCAMLGDSAGVASTAGGLGVVLTLRTNSEGKAL